MKLKKILLSVFSVVPLIVNFVFMFILPEQIPMHYGTDFKADRYGSKIEVWFLAAVILIMGIVFLIIARFMKEEVNKMLSAVVPKQEQIRKELEEIIKELEVDYHE